MGSHKRGVECTSLRQVATPHCPLLSLHISCYTCTGMWVQNVPRARTHTYTHIRKSHTNEGHASRTATLRPFPGSPIEIKHTHIRTCAPQHTNNAHTYAYMHICTHTHTHTHTHTAVLPAAVRPARHIPVLGHPRQTAPHAGVHAVRRPP